MHFLSWLIDYLCLAAYKLVNKKIKTTKGPTAKYMENVPSSTECQDGTTVVPNVQSLPVEISKSGKV